MSRNYSSSRAFSRAQYRWDSMSPQEDRPSCHGWGKDCDETDIVTQDEDYGWMYCAECDHSRSAEIYGEEEEDDEE